MEKQKIEFVVIEVRRHLDGEIEELGKPVVFTTKEQAKEYIRKKELKVWNESEAFFKKTDFTFEGYLKARSEYYLIAEGAYTPIAIKKEVNNEKILEK